MSFPCWVEGVGAPGGRGCEKFVSLQYFVCEFAAFRCVFENQEIRNLLSHIGLFKEGAMKS